MGKKRNRQPDLNDDGSEESAESCQASNSTGKECQHLMKSINFAIIRKEFKKITESKRGCAACKKSEDNSPQVQEEGFEPSVPIFWICLQCGNQACGRDYENHAEQHYKTPHSSAHSLVVNTHEWRVWCYDCDEFLNATCRPKLVNVVEWLKKATISNNRTTSKVKPQISPKELPAPEKGKQKILFGLTKVVGLANLGNTCFFNAVLQCLAQTPFLMKVLEDLQKPGQTFILPGGKYKKPGSFEEILLPPIEGTLEYEKEHGHFTQVLQKTLTEMQNSNGQQTYKPNELLSAFRKKTTQCMDGGQHDSHELLRHLLEFVRNEDLRRYQSVILKHLDLRGKLKAKNNCSDLSKEVDEEKLSRLKFYGHQASAQLLGPEPVFRGILVSTLECLECHHSSQRTEPFLDLSLPVTVDEPQPPVFKRKNNGLENSFDMMSVNSSTNNTTRALLKQRIMAAKKAAMEEQSNAGCILNSDLLYDTVENIEQFGVDNSFDMNSSTNNTTRALLKQRITAAKKAAMEEQSNAGCILNADLLYDTVENSEQFGVDNSFDINSLINNTEKASLKQRVMADGRTEKEKQSNVDCFLKMCQLNNSVENNETADIENANKVENSHYSSCVGSDTDVEDNVETESGTKPHSKSREILESGYSSEKASTLASPVSPDDSQATQDADSSLNSFNGRCNLALVPADFYSPLKNVNSVENLNSNSDTMEKTFDYTPTFENSSGNKINLFPTSESGTSLDLTKPDDTIDNLIKSSINSVESPVSPVEMEVSEEKIVADEKIRENGENDKETLKESEETSKFLKLQLDSDCSKIFSHENEINEDDASTNEVGKVNAALSRIGVHHSNQSPTRYFTNEGEYSIQSCLNKFTAQELMTGNNKVRCEACIAKENKGKDTVKMVYTPSTKQYLISKVPAVLILHLKRFQSQRIGFRKVSKHVSFPTVFDLASVCKNNKVPKIYSLYGVVEHSGTLYGGHYVAYVKTRLPLSPNDPRWSFLPTKEAGESDELSSDSSSEAENEEASAKSSKVEPLPGRWYHISDSSIWEVDESTVLQSQAYLLFYERIL